MKLQSRPVLSLFVLLALTFEATSLHADVTLPAVFSDHVVLQRDRPIVIWGEAAPGESVEAAIGENRGAATADADGRWRLKLAPLPASATPAELVVRGKNIVTVHDVLVGEVWLCSGQSNMEKPLGEQRGQKPTLNYEEELRTAEFPQIRLLKIAKTRAQVPASDVRGAWVVCSPATLDSSKFSAAGYFFGRRIFQELGVPVGLIDSTWGGTRIEPWTPPGAFALLPSLAELADAAKTAGKKAEGTLPCDLYYGMIAPLAPFSLRGFLWYQGESNLMDCARLDALRGQNGGAGARMARGVARSRAAVLLCADRAARLSHLPPAAGGFSRRASAILGSADGGERAPAASGHGRDDGSRRRSLRHSSAQQAGSRRTARTPRACAHLRTERHRGLRPGLSPDGNSRRPRADFLRLARRRARREKSGTALVVHHRRPDGKFFPANATIEDDHLVVSSPRVPVPAIVRFAWDEAAQPNLFNAAGLPAVPFRTDNPFLAAPGNEARGHRSSLAPAVAQPEQKYIGVAVVVARHAVKHQPRDPVFRDAGGNGQGNQRRDHTRIFDRARDRVFVIEIEIRDRRRSRR